MTVDRDRANLSAALALVAILSVGRPVNAEPQPCGDARVEVHGTPSPRWREAIGRACDELASLPDSDRSARVVILPADDDLILEVTLADGRSTLRRVRRPASLASALRALFELPPTAGASYLEAPPAPALAPSQGALDAPPRESAPLPPVAPTLAPAPPLKLGFEMGAVAASRLAGPGPYYSIGFSTFAQLEVGSWSLGAEARWEAFQWNPAAGPDLEMTTLALGLTIARRVRCGFGDVDLGVSPRLVAETQSDSVSTGENTLASADIRGAAFVRAAFGRGHPLRALVQVDAELSPSRVRRGYRLDPGLPALPAWGAGFGVGFAWAEP